MKSTQLPIIALLALLANGCAVGPNYQKPTVSAPTHWGEPLAGGETNRDASVADWWKNFRDPELDSLISRAAQSNLDLKIAQARVREARAEYGIAVGNLLPTVDARVPTRASGKARTNRWLVPVTICRRAYRLKTTSINPVSTPPGKLTCSAASAAPGVGQGASRRR